MHRIPFIDLLPLLSLLGALSVAVGCAHAPAPRTVMPAVHPELQELAAQASAPRMIRVSPRVHVAYAYDFANITFIEGNDGVIVIDARWSSDAAQEAIAAYAKEVSEKPRSA